MIPLVIWLTRFYQQRRISDTHIALFLKQLAALFSAGIPIIQCCDILEKCQDNTHFKSIIRTIRQDMLTGKSLSNSLQPHAGYFDAITCPLIQIGEHTGNLNHLLHTLSLHHDKQLDYKRRIRQALFYPGVITVIALAITCCLFIFIIPRFAELFSHANTPLPAITRGLFYLSEKIRQLFWLPVIPALLGLYHLKHTKPKPHPLSKLPVIRNLLHQITLTRFIRNLAIILAAGIPLTEALTLSMHQHQHTAFARDLASLRHHLHTGKQLHDAMSSLTTFPTLLIQMIKVGEESGALIPLLNKTADLFEADSDQLSLRLGQLLEPLIMIVLGALIGGLLIGLYLPIFTLGSTIG